MERVSLALCRRVEISMVELGEPSRVQASPSHAYRAKVLYDLRRIEMTMSGNF